MPKSIPHANALLLLLFNAVTYAGIGRDDASPTSVFYLSLHTASPGTTGDQTVNEVNYTNYSRVPLARTSAVFYVNSNSVFLVSPVYFPQASGGGSLATHWGLGTAPSGAGYMMYSGQIISPAVGVSIVNLMRPRVNAFKITEG